MIPQNKPTKVAQLIRNIQDNKLLSAVIVLGIAVIAVAKFTDAIEDIWKVLHSFLARAPATITKESFYYLYNFDDFEGRGRRTWTRQDADTWIETFPNGNKHTLRRVARINVDGDDGTLLQLDTNPNLQYFLPDRSSRTMWLRDRYGEGDPWSYLGEIHFDQ